MPGSGRGSPQFVRSRRANSGQVSPLNPSPGTRPHSAVRQEEEWPFPESESPSCPPDPAADELAVARASVNNLYSLAEELRERRSKVRGELDGHLSSYEAATRALTDLGGRPLSEIKQLAKHPPEAVRRSLAAIWVLLHADHFAGRTVRFDDLRDWRWVQRMLAEDSFISQILNFTVEKLGRYPNVQKYLLALFSLEGPPSPRVSRKTFRNKTSRGRRSSCPCLEVEAVERASQPCGALCRWILSMVTLLFHQPRLTGDLKETETSLLTTEEGISKLCHMIGTTEAARMIRANTAEIRREPPPQPTRPRTACEPRPRPAKETPVPVRSAELPIREVIRRAVHGKGDMTDQRLPQVRAR